MHVCFLFIDITDDCTNVAAVIVPPSLEDMLKNREGTLTCKASGANPGFTKIEIKANNFVIAEASEAHFKNKIKVELEAPIGYEEWSNGTVFTCTVEHAKLPQPMETTFKRENGMFFLFAKHRAVLASTMFLDLYSLSLQLTLIYQFIKK